MERLRKPLLAAVAALLLSVAVAGCEVEGGIEINLEPDGSGTVGLTFRFDSVAIDAIEASAGSREEFFEFDDLVDAGWSEPKWSSAKSGDATLSTEKPFANPGELEAILAEISGSSGVLIDPVVDVHESFFVDTTKVAVDVGINADTAGIASDSALGASISENAGDAAAVESDLAAKIAESARLSLTINPPYGSSETYPIEVGGRDNVAFETQRLNLLRIVAVAVAVGLIAFGIWIGIKGERKRLARAKAAPSRRGARAASPEQ